MRHMTFEEWKKANPDIHEIEDVCLECNGTGDHECECGSLHECGFCDGQCRQVALTLHDMYQAQFAKDTKLLERGITSVTPDSPKSGEPVN